MKMKNIRNEITLSIVIPTKDRELYLINVLENILSWSADCFELIVHDNSSNKKLYNLIKPFQKDLRLRYFHIEKEISVVENFELALNHTKGKIVCMIGDDDGVFEEIISVANWMLENDFDTLLPKRAIYTWPDLNGKYNSTYFNSKLRYSSGFSGNVSLIDIDKEIDNVLNEGCTSIKHLPRIYYGLVKKEILDKIKENTGSYIPGPSPDMASSISIAILSSSFAYLDYPIFISGSSSKSTSGQGAKKKHVGKIEDVKHLPKDTIKFWNNKIPMFWSGPNIWSQSAMRSLILLKRDDLINKNNFLYLYSYNIIFNISQIKFVLKAFNNNTNSIYCLIKIKFYVLKILMKRLRFLLPKIKSRFFNIKTDEVIIEDVVSISSAIIEFNNYKTRNNNSLKIVNKNAK